MNKILIQALWSLKEDATRAYNDAMMGREPDIYSLGRRWRTVEAELIRLDVEQTA